MSSLDLYDDAENIISSDEYSDEDDDELMNAAVSTHHNRKPESSDRYYNKPPERKKEKVKEQKPPFRRKLCSKYKARSLKWLNGKKKMEKKSEAKKNGEEDDDLDLPLMSLNHVSRLCKSVKDSVEFYKKVLGFVLIERPPAFEFDGAWLFNYGIGIHLVQANDDRKLPPDNDDLDPMDNHISFQCEDMEALERKLKDMEIKYLKRTVGGKEDGAIDQLFFNDPDGFMIEICNCENVKLKPAGSIRRLKLPFDRHNPPVELDPNAAKAS